VTIKEQEALRLVREVATEAIAAGGLPAFLAELERVRSEAILDAARPMRQPDRLWSVREAAERLGRSPSWVYKNKGALPLVRFPTGGFGFNSASLTEWIESRTDKRGK